jgi:hypothetical protein
VKPTSLLYKPGLFEAKGQSFRTELCWRKAKPKSVCCREAFEVETLSDRFWELGASVLHAVSFAGFLRSGTTRPDQSCSLWALLRCNFEHLSRNKEASPTRKKARRRRQTLCRTPLSTCVLMVCCSLCFSDLHMCFECHNPLLSSFYH